MKNDLKKAYTEEGKKFFNILEDDIQWVEKKFSYYKN